VRGPGLWARTPAVFRFHLPGREPNRPGESRSQSRYPAQLMSDTSSATQRMTDTRAVVQLGMKAATAYDRPDLGERLREVLASLDDRAFHVVVVGEFKQGKSSLVNALLSAAVCPVDDDIATAVPTFIRHGEEGSAEVVYTPEDDSDLDTPLDRESIPLDRIGSFVTEGRSSGRRIQTVEISLPRKLLARGIVVVDTPGVGGLGSSHGTLTLGALPMADAVVFVSDASQEYTRTEIDFLRQAQGFCPNIVCALTKIDFYPSWRRIRDLNQGHLETAGIPAEIMPLSSPLRLRAVKTRDRELNQESGFPRLVDFLNSEVGTQREADLIQRAITDVLDVTGQLESNFAAEREALADPESAKALVERLNATKEQTEMLKSRMARWNQTLGDGVADLAPAVDHDFRGRVRAILREADEAIEKIDPADVWDEFEPWLYQRVSHDVVANYAMLQQRAADLAVRVSEHFDDDSADIARHLEIYDPSRALEATNVNAHIEIEKATAGKKAMSTLTAVRGGYMGMVMFGMLSSMVGVALGPFGMGIAIVMGRKGLKDEKARQKAMRQAQGKNAVRKYCDEVSFHVNKDARDTVRRVQRQLRDHFSARAQELNRSANEALVAARQAAQTGVAQRESRLKDLDAEIRRLGNLRKRAESVLAVGAQS